MSTLEKIVLISPQEYLDGEQYSDVRHEYVAGHVYPKVGASAAHNLIVGNFHAALHSHFRGKPCQVFASDMKAHLADAYYYPDVMASCDPSDRHDYYRERPTLIIEVISPSTEARDALEKRVAYQSLESLQEYLLVAQDKMKVRIYRRANESWELETCTEKDNVRLTSVGLEIPIEQVYEDVWS